MRGIRCVAATLIIAAGTVPALAERGTRVIDDFAHGRSRVVAFERASHRRSATVPIGTRRIAVLLVNFADDRSRPLTADQVAAEMFTNADSTSAFLETQSAGRLTLTGDVFGYFEIPADSTPCDNAAWAEQVGALAAEQGIDLAGYDHVIYLHNDTGACDYGGVGDLPGSTVFLQASSRGAAAHELGHNFGLLHANAYVCQDEAGIVTLSADCEGLEYGDQYSMMGGGTMHQLNHWEKVKLGWMDPHDIETVTTSGTYTIAPASAPSGRRGLHIHRLVDCVSRDYFIEYRIAAPFDTAAPAPGVLVRLALADPRVGGRSFLLDMTPATGGGETDHDRELGLTDAALPVGATYTDPEAGLSFTVFAAADDRADIGVELHDPAASPPLGVGSSPQITWFADPDLTVPAATSADPALDFEWGTGAPRPDVTGDAFALRFDGVLAPATDGIYRFVTVSDDGVRLWIDDELVIDNWQIQAATRFDTERTLDRARAHRVRLEYFDHGGPAALRLGWQRAGEGACQVMTFSGPPPDADEEESGVHAGGCSASTRPPGVIAALLLLAGLVLVARRRRRRPVDCSVPMDP